MPEQPAARGEALAQPAGQAPAPPTVQTPAQLAPRPFTNWLAAGLLLALVGAVLAFALKDSEASRLGVSLQPLGGVLLAAGVLLVAAVAIGPAGSGGADAASIKSIGGLIAVVAGITAVTALAIVTLTELGSKNTDSIVAVTSSAFGIISAVVGAYLGIKISAETTEKASNEAKDAAVSKHVADDAKSKLDAVRRTASELNLTPEQEHALTTAEVKAGEEPARPVGPPSGGGQT
jgi:hypothetical protein